MFNRRCIFVVDVSRSHNPFYSEFVFREDSLEIAIYFHSNLSQWLYRFGSSKYERIIYSIQNYEIYGWHGTQSRVTKLYTVRTDIINCGNFHDNYRNEDVYSKERDAFIGLCLIRGVKERGKPSNYRPQLILIFLSNEC